MIKRIISIILLSCILGGCATNSRDEMIPDEEVHSTCIRWLKQKPNGCGKSGNFLGCTYRAKNGCTLIIMPEDTSDYVIAHEFKHAFGYKHVK